MIAANFTKELVGLSGHVIEMIDVLKFESFEPSNYLEYNRDFNGWQSIVNKNLEVVWYPRGKVVDAGVNFHGNFHDSKSVVWHHAYDHAIDVTGRHALVLE